MSPAAEDVVAEEKMDLVMDMDVVLEKVLMVMDMDMVTEKVLVRKGALISR